ncbi:Histone-lysine N-methyltransferase, H3 lysine-79 specific like [Actinidia chinensis var. chinensis]|uniref:Histone-lysine N-methyltransferase, H3 lysine-79 specific like n=1 Tax=Actinidia chinensis var. chinensis TaxID=1590841 RepID=A0A2R6RK48_ACTCC|nr:Histone-lysine N-methyltransferase, H3 lysine-79 specific like [Actinidia chinensis var. chinensis]
MEPDEQPEALSFCPSFSSYSSDVFAQIAAKVTEESVTDAKVSTSNDLDGDDDFEFDLVSGEEVLCDGRIREIFPVFNRDLLIRDDRSGDVKPDVSNLRLSLKNLFIGEREERDPPSLSSSSSEVDEFESIPDGTYCVWRPKLVDASPSRCKKSNSTGSASKRWRIRDLLRRSNSDGKDSLVLMTPKNKDQKPAKIHGIENPKERRISVDAGAGKAKAKAAAGEKVPASAHEVFYVRNRTLKEGDKRKSYLPYRQDLVGFFANFNGARKTFPPF